VDVVERHRIRIAKQRLNFAAAHFTLFPGGRAERLHGHNYQVELRAAGLLGPLGILVDFGALKHALAAVIRGLDERTLIPLRAPGLRVRRRRSEVEVRMRGRRYVFPRADVVLLPIENTTAELLAQYVGRRLIALLKRRRLAGNLQALEVFVSESPGQGAGYGALDSKETRGG
jgi:6-pyruvoyltetrahydropterin/6-carboxytetrahydropterin synthase